MATAPLGASSPPAENQFIRKKEEIKSFNPKANIEGAKEIKAKPNTPPPRVNKEVEVPKPSPSVNTNGQVTGTRINTQA